jgi:hypothetical protein
MIVFVLRGGFLFNLWAGKNKSVRLVGFGIRPHAPTMGFNDGARQVQPQPGAFGFAAGLLCPVKAVKDVGRSPVGNPGTFIHHADHHLVGQGLPADADLTARGIFDRIGDQVAEHLFDARFICHDDREVSCGISFMI